MLNYFGKKKQNFLNKYGLMGGGIDPMGGVNDQQLMQMQAAQRARGQVQDLVGERQKPYQMSEAELFPGEAQATLAPGLMNKGTGLVGGEKTPLEFYGGLMTTPGYQDIGAAGVQNLMNRTASQKPADFTLSPGQTRFGASGDIIAALAAEQKKGGAGSAFDMSTKLRKEFTNQTKDFVKVRDANRRISAAAGNPTAAGDMALIFNFMKVLDPGSTVREGEFATAQNATGVPSRITNLYNNVMSGERLNPAQRTDFVSQANNLYEAQLGGLAQLEDQYTGLSKTFGVDPKNVVVDYRVKRKEKKMSKENKEALSWAEANPNDPRAALILKKVRGR